MKKKIANRSIILLGFIFSFGLFQAWKESRNPFAFFKGNSQKVSPKYTKTIYINNLNSVKIEFVEEQQFR